MDYTRVAIKLTSADYAEILEAELAELSYESFELKETELNCFTPSALFEKQNTVDILSSYKDFIDSYEFESIAHQNWNAVWESSYDPVLVNDSVYIRAPFHDAMPSAEYTITLEPNMSFGTGHHPTTSMILEALSQIDCSQKTLFDFGCGSGILAIYFAMKGGNGIGIEIDEHAAEAARQNLRMNHIKTIEVRAGGMEEVKESEFDVIAANINRNVIEEHADILYAKLANDGDLYCAGFLNDDVPELSLALNKAGFQVIDSKQKDGWTMLHCIKKQA